METAAANLQSRGRPWTEEARVDRIAAGLPFALAYGRRMHRAHAPMRCGEGPMVGTEAFKMRFRRLAVIGALALLWTLGATAAAVGQAPGAPGAAPRPGARVIPPVVVPGDRPAPALPGAPEMPAAPGSGEAPAAGPPPVGAAGPPPLGAGGPPPAGAPGPAVGAPPAAPPGAPAPQAP